MDVVIFEEHSSVLAQLAALPRAARTLVCLDAHLDLQPVNPKRLEKLRACTSTDQLRALEKPHHLLPDQGYGYSLEDWLHPAQRLGLFSRLVWVAPPHVNIGFRQEVFAHLEQMDGVLPEEIAGFRMLPGGAFAGTLNGLPMTICNYRQLRDLEIDEPVVVDIDTDYFVEIPGDRPWIDPGVVSEALRTRFPAPDLVTISRSVGSGFLPLGNRYFADYLAASWNGHVGAADHYRRLFELEHAGAGDCGVLAEESAQFPDCAATWYLRGLRCADNAGTERAANIDPAYRESVLTRACAYPQRRLPLRPADCDELQQQLLDQSLPPRELACAQAAVGHVLCAVGRIGSAIELYTRCSAYFGSHPGLALEIGKALLEQGQAADAGGFLNAALDDDLSRTAARISLATLYLRRGKPGLALDHAAAAHDAAPAWGGVTLLLAGIHRQLGNTHAATALEAQQREQLARLSQLVRQHAG